MNQNSGGLTCVIGCWLVALLGGILIAAMLMNLAGFAFIAAAFFGIVALALGGIGLTWAFCRGLPGPNEVTIDPAKPGADARASNAGHGVAASATAAGATAASAASVQAKSASADAQPAAGRTDMQPSARLAGEEELAGRKGEWKYDGGSDPEADAAAKAKADADAAAAKAKADADAAAKAKADAEAAAARAKADEDMARSSRVAATPSSAAAAAAEAKPVAADGKPELLTAAREGGPDDLKQIKGVGTVMEEMLHDMGVFHFDQVASWRPAEIDWVDANLPKFKGRVKRDNWVDQAKILAAGGETEFSKKVEKGSVSYNK